MIKATRVLLPLALTGGVLCAATPAVFAQDVVGLGVQGRPHGGGTPERMFAFRHGLRHYRSHGRLHRTHGGYRAY